MTKKIEKVTLKTFDIRKSVCNPDASKKSIQDSYDEINLMIKLFGDLNFKKLFTTNLYELSKIMKKRLDDGDKEVSKKQLQNWKTFFQYASKKYAKYTLSDLVTVKNKQASQTLFKLIKNISPSGLSNFVIPPTSNDEQLYFRSLVMMNLTNVLSKVKLIDIYTLRRDDSIPTPYIIEQTKIIGLWWNSNNDRCCKRGGAHRSDQCITKSKRFCKMDDPPHSHHCVSASDNCP